jgi:isopentenyldiphosphate isomerase
MELWDVYDVNRSKTDKVVPRGRKLNDGEYRLVVHACIFNSKGEMLIQQRQSFKDGWPNMWDLTCGGSAIKGETSQMAIDREVKEELGIEINSVRPHITINFENGFDDIYLIEKEVNIDNLKLQYEEVQNVKWATKDEIVSMIEEKVFIPYYPSLINLLFEARKHYGERTRKDEEQ